MGSQSPSSGATKKLPPRVLAGLPISEYPEVVPPTIVVRATYPGANPTVIADTVASPLEQAINGVEDMLYQYSQATSDGVMTLTVTFKLGMDPNMAQVLTQNRVSLAQPRLRGVDRTAILASELKLRDCPHQAGTPVLHPAIDPIARQGAGQFPNRRIAKQL